MHSWIRVTPPPGSLKFVQPFIVDNNGGGAYGPFFDGSNLAAIADGAWHELVTNLSATTKGMTRKLGIQLPSLDAQASGGPATPTAVDVYLDNIWLE